MFPMQERQLSLSSLFKKNVHNAIRHFSYFKKCWVISNQAVFRRISVL